VTPRTIDGWTITDNKATDGAGGCVAVGCAAMVGTVASGDLVSAPVAVLAALLPTEALEAELRERRRTPISDVLDRLAAFRDRGVDIRWERSSEGDLALSASWAPGVPDEVLAEVRAIMEEYYRLKREQP
jgi:hypothetical protein